MNKYQRLVMVAALMNTVIMLLFPPFVSQPLARGVLPSFDGFYPLVTTLGSKPIYSELLILQLLFVLINTLAGWLVLQTKKHHKDIPDFAFTSAIGWFTLANLAIIFAFPPFEPYQSLLRTTEGGFDSFYFILGSRSQRTIYTPMLYLECMFVVVNALGLLLLFNAVKRGDDAARERLMQLTEGLPDAAIGELAENLKHRIEAQHSVAPLGRKVERRIHQIPVTQERRTKTDRRGK